MRHAQKKQTIILTTIVLFALCLQWTKSSWATQIPALIESLEVGEPVYHENLTIIPVYNTNVIDRTAYTTLDEALRRNWLEITEVNNSGNVPKVRLTNRSKKHIYIMGGEILSGGKQDRIVGRDVFIGPKSRNVIIPVYCTEAGRWQYESKKFYSKKNLGTWNMRALSQYAPAEAQSGLWGDISSRSQKLDVSSRTSAYQGIYEDKEVKDKIGRHERHLQNIPSLQGDTIGVVVGVGGEIISVDLFANPRLFRKLWPKILKSSALSAVSSDTSASITEHDAVAVLRRIHDAHYTRNSALDQGYELSAYNNSVNVNALIYRNTVLHLAGFPTQTKGYNIKQNHDSDRRIPVMRRQY